MNINKKTRIFCRFFLKINLHNIKILKNISLLFFSEEKTQNFLNKKDKTFSL